MDAERVRHLRRLARRQVEKQGYIETNLAVACAENGVELDPTGRTLPPKAKKAAPRAAKKKKAASKKG